MVHKCCYIIITRTNAELIETQCRDQCKKNATDTSRVRMASPISTIRVLVAGLGKMEPGGGWRLSLLTAMLVAASMITAATQETTAAPPGRTLNTTV